MLLAQEFQFMRREVDHQETPARTQHPADSLMARAPSSRKCNTYEDDDVKRVISQWQT